MSALLLRLLGPSVIGVVAALLVGLIDVHCFPDLVHGNLGYSLLQVLRVVPLCWLSLFTGAALSLVSGRQARRAGVVGLAGGMPASALLLLALRGEYRSTVADVGMAARLREALFAWGELTAWAVALAAWGLALLWASRVRGTTTPPGPPARETWPPAPNPSLK